MGVTPLINATAVAIYRYQLLGHPWDVQEILFFVSVGQVTAWLHTACPVCFLSCGKDWTLCGSFEGYMFTFSHASVLTPSLTALAASPTRGKLSNLELVLPPPLPHSSSVQNLPLPTLNEDALQGS